MVLQDWCITTPCTNLSFKFCDDILNSTSNRYWVCLSLCIIYVIPNNLLGYIFTSRYPGDRHLCPWWHDYQDMFRVYIGIWHRSTGYLKYYEHFNRFLRECMISKCSRLRHLFHCLIGSSKTNQLTKSNSLRIKWRTNTAAILKTLVVIIHLSFHSISYWNWQNLFPVSWIGKFHENERATKYIHWNIMELYCTLSIICVSL